MKKEIKLLNKYEFYKWSKENFNYEVSIKNIMSAYKVYLQACKLYKESKKEYE